VYFRVLIGDKKDCILQSCYYLLCGSCPSLLKGLVPTAPEQPTEEMENQIKSPTAVPDAPPDYNSHFAPGNVNFQISSSFRIP
jgi:hypothetical protein